MFVDGHDDFGRPQTICYHEHKDDLAFSELDDDDEFTWTGGRFGGLILHALARLERVRWEWFPNGLDHAWFGAMTCQFSKDME